MKVFEIVKLEIIAHEALIHQLERGDVVNLPLVPIVFPSKSGMVRKQLGHVFDGVYPTTSQCLNAQGAFDIIRSLDSVPPRLKARDWV